MEGGVIRLKKEKSSVRTFLRFCPSIKKELFEDSKESQWIFNTGDHGKSIKASRKPSISKARCCTVTDEIFKEDVCNSDIYRKTRLQQHAVNVLDGISTNIIVCGPHKTGKTNLLIGSQRSIGLVLQSIYDIFAAIRCYTSGIHVNEKGVSNETSGNFDRLFVVKASVLEIGEDSSNFKLDNVRDLIDPENPLQLIKNLGELGYTIRGEHEHLFENEEKLVASILSAVARKKVLDSIRRERLNGKKKKKTPEQIQNTIFGDFGERWVKDDILGSLVITISVESVDKSELENNIRKSERVINGTHVNLGTLRFFEISSCVSTSAKVKTVIPLFGLLDLAFEIRKYCFTNEKSNRINITNISSYIASTIADSNLILVGTLSRSPVEKKCCIRPLLAPYDNQSTVQPHSIFDTLQFLEYVGNSMKFPTYPQRNSFKKPFIQSKLVEICRKNVMRDPNQKDAKMVIKSERGIWQSESSGRVTRIIRLLTFINRSIEGSGILRILMSGNDDDIIRIYCENIIGSGVIDLDDFQMNNCAGKWFQVDSYRLPEKNLQGRKNVEYINQMEQKFGENKGKGFKKETALTENKHVKFNDKKEEREQDDGFRDRSDNKIKNLDFTIKNDKVNDLHFRDIPENEAPRQNSSTIKLDETILSSSEDGHFADENEIDITDIFNSKAFGDDENKLDHKGFNINLCEKLDKSSKAPDKKMFVSENVGNSNKNVDECIGYSNPLGNQTDEIVGPDSNMFDPVKQYEKLLKKTISLNKLQESILENQEKRFRDECSYTNSDRNSTNSCMLSLEGKPQSGYFQPANRKAFEAGKKAVEASKKAIEASRHLYQGDAVHTRGKVHDHIPASNRFPQVDIYAPSYDSDIEYDRFHSPKDIIFGLKSSPPHKVDECHEHQLLTPHYESRNSGEKDTCPCCENLSRRNKCRCHYVDASVNFNGISETSVNTDKSLLAHYEPGAGKNEKIKPNGRSWDIFVNVPERFADATSLGFGDTRSCQGDSDQELSHDYMSDRHLVDSDSPVISSCETIPDEYFLNPAPEVGKNLLRAEAAEFSSNSAALDREMDSYDLVYENEGRNIKNNILEDLREIKRQTSNLKNQFPLDPRLFRPLYDGSAPELCKGPFEKRGRAPSISNFAGGPSSESGSYLCFKSSSSPGENSVENINNFPSSQTNKYCAPEASADYPHSQDKYLEDMEMDISEQASMFPGYVGSGLADQGCSEVQVNGSGSGSNYGSFPVERIIREVGCCHTKYILPFPDHLRPRVTKGGSSFKFPYLKSLY